ncbi:MAG: restriction endonuclease subunit S, partial [Kiritimatiellae bacterium]|nr:restriction endonuclease subunit S [Kiritimatiellia bacterium]
MKGKTSPLTASPGTTGNPGEPGKTGKAGISGISGEGGAASPAPWPVVKLGEVCEEVKRLKLLTPPPTQIEYIDIASIDRNAKRIVSTTRHVRATMPGRAQQLVQRGDVLISTVRPNLNSVAVVEVEPDDCPLVASTGFSVVRPKKGLLSKYLYLYFQTADFIDPLVAVSEKASYPAVTDKIVKDRPIPLPPLSVQREIVARLERELGEVEKVAAGFKKIAETAEAEFKAELSETFGPDTATEQTGGAAPGKPKRTGKSGTSGLSGISGKAGISGISGEGGAASPAPWPVVKLGEVCEEVKRLKLLT